MCRTHSKTTFLDWRFVIQSCQELVVCTESGTPLASLSHTHIHKLTCTVRTDKHTHSSSSPQEIQLFCCHLLRLSISVPFGRILFASAAWNNNSWYSQVQNCCCTSKITALSSCSSRLFIITMSKLWHEEGNVWWRHWWTKFSIQTTW